MHHNCSSSYQRSSDEDWLQFSWYLTKITFTNVKDTAGGYPTPNIIGVPRKNPETIGYTGINFRFTDKRHGY